MHGGSYGTVEHLLSTDSDTWEIVATDANWETKQVLIIKWILKITKKRICHLKNDQNRQNLKFFFFLYLLKN